MPLKSQSKKFWGETGIICHQKISGCAPPEPPAADLGLQLSWPRSRSALLRVLNLSSGGYGEGARKSVYSPGMRIYSKNGWQSFPVVRSLTTTGLMSEHW